MGAMIFVNYRRDPDAPRARNLAQALKANFGEQNVFFDSDSVTDGEEWPQRLRDTLAKSSVILAVIGPAWLSARDPAFRRRIDTESDWVRKEIEFALEKNIPLVPVLVGGATLPRPEDLPPSLRPLTTRNLRELRDDCWRDDVEAFLRILKDRLQHPGASGIIWPIPGVLKPMPLLDEQVQQVLHDLPEWRVEETPLLDDPRVPHGAKQELVRVFHFDSFLDVMAYMARATPHIDAMDHHPRWENVYRTLIVRLTTWDIKHRLSDRDAVLARYLERLYKECTAMNRQAGGVAPGA